jgi:hypothetical protein
MPVPRVLTVSAATGEGIEVWLAWLDQLRASRAAEAPTR